MARRNIRICERCGRVVERVYAIGEPDGLLVDGRQVWVREGREPPGRLYISALAPLGWYEPTSAENLLPSRGRAGERTRGPFRVSHADTCGK